MLGQQKGIDKSLGRAIAVNLVNTGCQINAQRVGLIIVPAKAPIISAHCIRVAVADGHMATCWASFDKPATKEEIIERWRSFEGVPQKLNLPSAPHPFIQYCEEDNRPQTKLDRDFERGMGVSMGRLRGDSLFDWRFVGLSHNTLRGAAGGAVLIAELLCAQGYFPKK